MESETKTVKAVADYIAEVSRLAKTGKATEHTFRGALAALIDALAPGLKAVNEPRRSDCGAPDYIVQNKTGLGVFYVEAKDLGDDDLDGRKRTGHKEAPSESRIGMETAKSPATPRPTPTSPRLWPMPPQAPRRRSTAPSASPD